MIGPTRAEYWLVWVGEHNGYSYELVFVGDPKYTQEIGEASSDFRHGMRMIDPKRVAHKSASDFITTYKSKAFGYDIDLTGLGWAKADPAALRIPVVEVYGCSGNGSGVVHSLCRCPIGHLV